MLDRERKPRVTDFGLAKYLDRDTELTQSERAVGTPYYVSPEQAQGERNLTTATDIYSLGAVLYHLLTGQPVAQANTAWETLRAVVEQAPAPPTALNPRVDRDLGTICLKCLEKRPQQRYASADALAEDLERWLRREPILARRSGPWEHALKWGRRKPLVAGLTAALVLVALAGIGGIVRYARQANLERLKAQKATQDATEKLWRSYLAEARANRWSHRPGQRFNSLAALSNAAAIRPTLELRNEAIAALALPDARVARYWPLDPPVPLFGGLVFDVAVERYARAYPDGQIAICRAQDDAELFRLPSSGPWREAALCFSPDGRYLAEKHAGPRTNFFRIWDLERRESVLVRPGPMEQVPFAFTPDSRFVAAARGQTIYLYELSSGRETRQIHAPFAPAHLRFDPAGQKLAICIDSRRDLVVLDVASGSVVRTFDAGPTGCAWNYDGSLLASTCFDSQVYLWDVGRGQLQGQLKGHTAPAIKVVGSPTSDLLASSGWDGKTRFWDAILLEQLFSLPGDLDWFSPPSPGDQRLGFHMAEHHAGIWELATARECLRWPVGGMRGATFDRSGQLLVTVGEQGIAFWDAERRRLLVHLPIGKCCAIHPAADGKSVLIAGSRGVERWPFNFDPVTRHLRLGTAESLWQGNVPRAAISPGGRILVAETESGSELIVLDTEQPGQHRSINTHARRRQAARARSDRLGCGPWSARESVAGC